MAIRSGQKPQSSKTKTKILSRLQAFSTFSAILRRSCGPFWSLLPHTSDVQRPSVADSPGHVVFNQSSLQQPVTQGTIDSIQLPLVTTAIPWATQQPPVTPEATAHFSPKVEKKNLGGAHFSPREEKEKLGGGEQRPTMIVTHSMLYRF